jgi:hypothetical protein
MQNAPVNSRAITLVAVTVFGLVFAVVAGHAVAVGNLKVIMMATAASVGIAIGLMLGKHYWLLIPITFFAGGSIGALPVPFSYQEIGIIGAFGLYLFHIAFKKQSTAPNRGVVDLFLWLNIAYLISVYVRNPVGTLAFQSELVGGRPYFILLLVVCGYIVLSKVRVDERMARTMPVLLAAAMIIPASLFVITEFVPATVKVIYPFYTGVNIEDFRIGEVPGGNPDETRITSLAGLGRPIMLALCAYYPPITLMSPLYFGRFSLTMVGLALSALSGFRNVIAAIGAYMVIGSAVRRRFADIGILALVGMVGVIFLLGVHVAGLRVPFAVQRALSFIPIGWDENAVLSGSETADWRFEMWEDAWTRPGLIRSKAFGDGFGYTMKEMMIISDSLLGIGGFMGAPGYEAFLVKGAYHSGPLSTIKRVGFVGGALFMTFMMCVFFYSLRITRRAAGTPFFCWSLFITLPILYLPFEYIFIFGDYTDTMKVLIFSTAMLKMIENSLPSGRTGPLANSSSSKEAMDIPSSVHDKTT